MKIEIISEGPHGCETKVILDGVDVSRACLSASFRLDPNDKNVVVLELLATDLCVDLQADARVKIAELTD
jgi:hypothetical protein